MEEALKAYPAPEFNWRSFKEFPKKEEPVLIQWQYHDKELRTDLCVFDGVSVFKRIPDDAYVYTDIETGDRLIRWAYLPKVDLDGYYPFT